MSIKNPVIAITGSSGAGTTSVTRAFQHIFRREKLNAAKQQGIDTGFRKNISMAAVDKTSPAICRILLLGYSDGYFSKQDVSGLLRIKEKHVPKFFAEVEKW